MTLDRFPGSGRAAYLAERKKRREEAQAEDRAVRPLAPPEECCSEEDIRQRKPRILLTNYRQLEVLTTRLPDVALFVEAPIKYLVFDEAHTYSGATGAEVACLVRRVRALAGKKPDEITCIGTSATLSDPSRTDTLVGPDRQECLSHSPEIRFASRFFGVDANKVTLVGESYVSREWPKVRYRPGAPHGDGMERLGRVLDALSEPVQVASIKAVVEELTGQAFDPGDKWQEKLFDLLITNEYVFQSTQVLQKPKRLEEAAWATSRRVAMGRMVQGDKANAELLAYLVLGAAAQKGGEALLRPKVHFFLRGLDEMVVALCDSRTGTPACPEAATGKSAGPTETEADLFMSLSEGKEQHAGRHDDAFFPVLTCRSCGQHFFEQYYKELEFAKGPKNQLRGFEHGNATQDDEGKENAVWSTAPAENGTRLVLTNRLLEEADGGPTTKSTRWPKAWFCRQCGAMHRESAARCRAEHAPILKNASGKRKAFGQDPAGSQKHEKKIKFCLIWWRKRLLYVKPFFRVASLSSDREKRITVSVRERIATKGGT
ncbi:MAG TPA: hypothetical protein VH575_15415 [Gemmataceae bacterium]